jgi:hypothetical protein
MRLEGWPHASASWFETRLTALLTMREKKSTLFDNRIENGRRRTRAYTYAPAKRIAGASVPRRVA